MFPESIALPCPFVAACIVPPLLRGGCGQELGRHRFDVAYAVSNAFGANANKRQVTRLTKGKQRSRRQASRFSGFLFSQQDLLDFHERLSDYGCKNPSSKAKKTAVRIDDVKKHAVDRHHLFSWDALSYSNSIGQHIESSVDKHCRFPPSCPSGGQ